MGYTKQNYLQSDNRAKDIVHFKRFKEKTNGKSMYNLFYDL